MYETPIKIMQDESLNLVQILQNQWVIQITIKFMKFVISLGAQLSDITLDSQLVEDFERVIESYFGVFGETGQRNFKVKENCQR
jgi:hypothetical protein